MSSRDALLVKSVRVVIAAVLVVLLAAVVYHFALRRPGASRRVPQQAVPEALKVDRKEGIRHREYKDGKAWADLRADRFFLGPDGLDHLEGAVEIVSYDGADGRETRITADRVAYDKDMVHFRLSGRVNVRGQSLRFASDSLDYDKSRGTYRTETGGTFSSESLAGSGRTFEYFEAADELRLSGGFHLEVTPDTDASRPVILTGDVLTYSRREKTGRVEGRASLEGGEASGSSASARFELTGDERFLRSVTLERGARCSFSSGGKGPGGRVIEAETIRLQSFPEFSKVRSVDAVGNARLSLAASSGESGLVRAGEIGLALDREGRIESWTAAGDAFMDSTDSSGGKRELAAGTISFLVREGLLSARTSEGALARLESDEARIEAPTIGLAEGADNAEASNGVRCLLKPRSAGAPVGFFARGEPVFVTSRAMKSLGQERRLHFEGDVRAWQGEETLQAGELDVLQDTGGAGARKGVTAGFPHGGRDETHPRRIEAGGNEMTYTPSDRVVAFRGRSFVKIPDARLAAATVSVGFSEGEKRVKELRARTAVIFVFGDYEGRGDEAVYDPVAETLVLTGHPLLVEKGRGSSGGDKLTFRLGDGRILIENKGRGRSISVVKS